MVFERLELIRKNYTYLTFNEICPCMSESEFVCASVSACVRLNLFVRVYVCK